MSVSCDLATASRQPRDNLEIIACNYRLPATRDPPARNPDTQKCLPLLN